MASDPHRNAFPVLFNKVSARIETNLRPTSPLKASTDRLCLNCHAMPDGGAAEVSETTSSKAECSSQEGFSCESCHGAAEKWIGEHVTKSWKDKTPEEKIELGMKPTKDLYWRVNMCAGCHVGGPDREVNHDLVAAGHPRLNFEFAAYHALLPKHWSEKDDRDRYADFEARAWKIGQLVSAKAALVLLANRANDEKKPWPEFAEYDCYACHHAVQGRPEMNWRQRRFEAHVEQKAPGKIGALVWADWYYSRVSDVAGDGPVFQELRQEMGRRSPDRPKVARWAETAAQELEPWLNRQVGEQPANAGSLRRGIQRLAKPDDFWKTSSWDEQAQLYLEVAALYNALGDLNADYRAAAYQEGYRDLARLAISRPLR